MLLSTRTKAGAQCGRLYARTLSSQYTAHRVERDHHFWVRAEVKPHEQRTILLPEHTQRLLQHGHQVTVEESGQRCVKSAEYKAAGCRIAPEGSWKTAPKDAIICGLKELPEDGQPIAHRHMYFAHAYKGQKSAPQLLQRFRAGGGALWDLEYLVNDHGKRIAAFGFAAGASGMAVGLLAWAWQQRFLAELAREPAPTHPPILDTYRTFDDLAQKVRAELAHVNRTPRVHVVGASGRVGSGAVSFAKRFSLPLVLWDHNNTRGKLGPFMELFDSDIFVNAILLSPGSPPMKFITHESLAQVGKNRQLTMIVDVSCDPFNPLNPIPLYDDVTTLDKPTRRLVQDAEKPLDIVAIDHLPSLVPEESSREFADLLLPHLLEFPTTPVWQRAEKLFYDKCREVLGSAQQQ